MTTNLGIAKADVDEMKRTLALFYRPEDIVEVRAIFDGGGKPTMGGYFDYGHWNALTTIAAQLNNQGYNVYIIPNHIHPGLIARIMNKVVLAPKNLTQNDDVTDRRYWLIDFDPKRPNGISATDAEHDVAIKTTYEALVWLGSQGYEEAAITVADSGNGGHLDVPVALPNDEKSTTLIERCQQAVKARFESDKISVDVSVTNAARIWKF
jgi:hypothetical protein